MWAPGGVFVRSEGECLVLNLECLHNNGLQVSKEGGTIASRLGCSESGYVNLEAASRLQVIVHSARLASPRITSFNTTPSSQLHPPQRYLCCIDTTPANYRQSPPRPRRLPREPIPTSDKAAQPAIMKPVVSAFNAWTWYVASNLVPCRGGEKTSSTARTRLSWM